MRASTLHCLLALLIAATALGCTGCFGHRLSDGQAQALADARAGAMAAQQKRDAIEHDPDPVRASLDAQALLDDLSRGLIGFTLAATANADLPTPTARPEVLLDPEQATKYAQAGKIAAAHPPGGWGASAWAKLGGAAVGIFGLALTLGKNVPGIAGVAFTIASAGWKLIAPQKAKDAEEAVDDSLDIAVAYGERLANIATNAGFGHLVEDAKLRAKFLAVKLGATDEIERRLAIIRAGGVVLPSLPADSRPAQPPVKPEPTPPA